jgi:lipopolysaccharide biosynthesis regulator YciM
MSETVSTAPPHEEQNPAFLERLGNAFLQAGLPDEALKVFSQVSPNSPRYPEALRFLMKIHADAGEAEPLLATA